METTVVNKHPVFAQLVQILDLDETIDWTLEENYSRCIWPRTASNERCKRWASKDNILTLGSVLSELQAFEEFSDSEETYRTMKRFIDRAFCSQSHLHKAQIVFADWKDGRLLALPDRQLTPPATPEKDNVIEIETPACLIRSNSTTSIATLKEPTCDEPMIELTSQGQDEIIGQLSSLKIASTVQYTEVSIGHDTVAQSQTIITTAELGVVSPRRAGSIRDCSSVYKTISSHPTPSMMSKGIVYVLEHTKDANLFKVGWSKFSAEKRLYQNNNCYGVDTRPVYQSSEAFAGAHQAEKLAHVLLRHNNLRVAECTQCGAGHREWFQSDRDTVVEAAKVSEQFLLLPAYTLQNGVWKLSPSTYSHLEPKCKITVSELSGFVTSIQEASTQEKTLPGAAVVEMPMDNISETTEDPDATLVESEQREDSPVNLAAVEQSPVDLAAVEQRPTERRRSSLAKTAALVSVKVEGVAKDWTLRAKNFKRDFQKERRMLRASSEPVAEAD